jgi:uncharacterized protein (TIGR03083 family)
MTATGTDRASGPDLARDVAEEYLALAELLASSPSEVWDAPSLCQGWRTREVVAHVTMPARYSEPAFMAELQAAGGDFTRLSNAVATRDGALPVTRLLEDLRSDVLHAWQPPGGGIEGALLHGVIHGLDIIEAFPLRRTVPAARVRTVLDLLSSPDGPNPFGIELSGVRLEADDMEWSLGSGELVSGPGQALVLVLSGRSLPPGRVRGSAAALSSRGKLTSRSMGPAAPEEPAADQS